MARSPFHFSPRPNRAAEIGWREWSAGAFEEAQREDRPVLLGISAVWCHWCHVMDETTYSDADIIGLINERFVPIRVDNDQRPDINARYNMGGWPTTAFLTPGGEVMAGMTYIPPDQMRDVLNQVSTYYKDNKATIEEKIAEIIAEPRARRRWRRGRDSSDQILRDVLHSASDAYDPVFGGFGSEPKFPHTDAIDLLLHAYLRDGDRDALHMARKTLEYMYARRHLRPGVGRLLPLLDEARLERPSLREDARGQRAAPAQPAEALPHHRRRRPPPLHRLHDRVPRSRG